MRYPIHFAHANGFPGATYQPLLERFAPDHPTFAISKLGHNPDFPVNDNWDDLAHELIAYLRLHVTEPVIGIGHSLGALTTFKAAILQPELFKGLIMLDPPLVYGARAIPFFLLKIFGLQDYVTPAGRTRGRRQQWPNKEQARRYFKGKALFKHFDTECMESFLMAGLMPCESGVQLAFDPNIELAIYRTTPHNWLWQRSRLQVPGLLLTGESSPVFARSSPAGFIARHGLEWQTIPGGHMFPLEQPYETVSRIRQWLERRLSLSAYSAVS